MPKADAAGNEQFVQTEGIVSCSQTVATLTFASVTAAAPTLYIELVNKGGNSVYFRTDGTTPTAGATGNADVLLNGDSRIVQPANITAIKFICSAGETATVFYRILE